MTLDDQDTNCQLIKSIGTAVKLLYNTGAEISYLNLPNLAGTANFPFPTAVLHKGLRVSDTHQDP